MSKKKIKPKNIKISHTDNINNYEFQEGDQVLAIISDNDSGLAFLLSLYYVESEAGFVSLVKRGEKLFCTKFIEDKHHEIVSWQLVEF